MPEDDMDILDTVRTRADEADMERVVTVLETILSELQIQNALLNDIKNATENQV